MRPTADQARVIDSWGEGMAVIAGAGSGKTSTLVKKCVEAVKRNPKAKICAVSFTEKSTADLRAKLSDQFSLQGHWVMTIHGLCSAILREYPREGGFDGEESILAEDEAQTLWERAMEVLWYNDLAPEIEHAVDLLSQRETKEQLLELLIRVRELRLFGVVESLLKQEGEAHALGVLSSFVLERYARLKRRRSGVDFSDLEQAAIQALSYPHVAQSFQERFDLVLVDEFQDTNPLQADMIWKLIKPDASNLVVVGDPKQSIYRFRDADVSVFEERVKRLKTQVVLRENFRSRAAILDFCNQVCAPAFEASSMHYEPLLSGLSASSVNCSDQDEAAVLELPTAEPKDLAVWIQSQIKAGVKLEDMVLLLRSVRGSGWKWIEALTQAGIPLSVGSGGLFWKDPRVSELVAFLKWWVWPTDTLAAATFLRAPWLDLLEGQGNAPITDVELEGWLLAKDPLLAFLNSAHWAAQRLAPLLNQVKSPAELLQVLIRPEVEPELGVAWFGVWNRCQELSSEGFSISQVAKLMDQWVLEGKREREIPPPKAVGCLQVLTVHGSKGLEFKHVILADFGSKPARAKPLPWLFYQREQGVFLSARDLDQLRVESEDEKRFAAVERIHELAEVKRVFYVALTRAMQRLVLVTSQDGAKIKEGASVWESDHWLGWVQESGAKIQKIDHFPNDKELITSQDLPSPVSLIPSVNLDDLRQKQIAVRPRHSITEWNTLSHCERQYQWKFLNRPEYEREKFETPLDFKERLRIEPYREDYLSTRELGTRVHELLEKVRDADFEERLQALTQEVGHERLNSRSILDWVKSSTLMSFELEHWNEFAFEVPFENQVLVGAMDRLVYDSKSGRYTIVDFKVTAKDLAFEELELKYKTQLDLYVWALGQLEPSAQNKTDCVLVHIGPSRVQELKLLTPSHQSLRDLVKKLAIRASELVQGQEGAPQITDQCRFCPFEKPCLK